MTPMTELRGYSFELDGGSVDPRGELSEDELHDAVDWLTAEIQNRLPDYAEWVPETSSIILPIDKVEEFDIDWNALTEDVWFDYCEGQAEI